MMLPWGRIVGLVLGLALLAGVAWVIRDGGKDAGLAEGEKVRAALAESLAYAHAQASTCSATLGRITTETERGVREAEDRARAGEAEAAKARQAAKDADARAERASSALSAALRDPNCSTVLRMTVCPAVELL